MLLCDEFSSQPTFLPSSDGPNEFAVDVDNAFFQWDSVSGSELEGFPNSEVFALNSINFKILKGAIVAIVGPVGSGKSSLLSALIGEMSRTSGTVTFRGSVAYCQQIAWIQNSTVRENILFGKPFNQAKYDETIRVCALAADFAQFSDGDQTEIGEKGVNLSGGQKQRVSIARAVYSDTDIILFDDQLSAVDSHVGRYLFEDCFKTALAGKTRIVVSHQLHFLPNFDFIFVMENGKIVSQGTFNDLKISSPSFSALMNSYGGSDDSDTLSTSQQLAPVIPAPSQDIAAKKFMSLEERNVGAVSGTIYRKYILLAGGTIVIIVTITNVTLAQGARVMTDQWLAFWTSNKFDLALGDYLWIYCLLGIVQVIFTLTYGFTNAYFGAKASQKVHDASLGGILNAPLAFFDATPSGRITSRFSRDVDTLDTLLPESARVFIFTLAFLVSNFVLISSIFPWFLIPLTPMVWFFYRFQSFYRATSRELKRLDSVTRSPLVATISETLGGVTTIRAYGCIESFRANAFKIMDHNNSTYYLTILIQRWMQLRLESLNSILVLVATLFSIIFRSTINSGISGLAISYCLLITSTFTWCIKQATDTEMNMNSAERMIHYIDSLPSEDQNCTPAPADWPREGSIEGKSLVMRYRPELPPVLCGLDFSIRPREKIGIVGRTGAGKSTVLSALLRLFELESGSITIDGIDIKSISVESLRSGIAVIPQDPVLFSGTIRFNIDPFSKYRGNDSN